VELEERLSACQYQNTLLEKRNLNKNVIKEIIEYVEEAEVTMDAEMGEVRSLDELIKDGRMPSFYLKLKKTFVE